MIVRKSVVRVTARLRKDVHRRLVQEAKARDISLNDEIERRIEESFHADSWPAERLNLLTALEFLLKSIPQSAAMRDDWKSKRVDMSRLASFLEQIKEADEADFQKKHLPEIMKDKPRPSKRD